MANGFDEQWYVSCKVYDNNVNLLLDSGASVCFLDYDVYLAITNVKRLKLDKTFCDVSVVNVEKFDMQVNVRCCSILMGLRYRIMFWLATWRGLKAF